LTQAGKALNKTFLQFLSWMVTTGRETGKEVPNRRREGKT
jgi:hypothetical protein